MTPSFLKASQSDTDDLAFCEAVRLPANDRQILLAFISYIHQVQPEYSLSFCKETLQEHPHIPALLIQLFKTRFEGKLTQEEEEAQTLVLKETLDEHIKPLPHPLQKTLFQYLNALTLSIVRTNAFQSPSPSVLSFKIDCSQLSFLPEPRPWREIFVYAEHVEGVHLRGGPKARGGIRFSDRPGDYRTEILGLFKTQMVKNAIIVPTGAKGGFIAKKLPDPKDRAAFSAEVTRCYKDFITALLEITDNIVHQEIVPPENTKRYDGDDPYFVVAADKGTATFSDTANAISEKFSFWLGDPFASGGSQGYDHKALGITARGAWISVERHLWEAGFDPVPPLRALGIGSMAGDVFGNGMLLSDKIHLVGAFTRDYIFLDPNPDPLLSFQERARLFNLPRSSWADYGTSKISKGGGVFLRSAPSIPLSPEIQALLNLSESELSPNALIQYLLKSPVDLLWLGGIGTFVKASTESHADAQDPQNDAIRIDAPDLKAKVIGEGANLGFTQAARIEYALQGGRLNTDAIDNAAGVDCSDHEVNIKIFLQTLLNQGKISLADRNTLLIEMTEDVIEKVLDHNRNQTLALSLSQYAGEEEDQVLHQWVGRLEHEGFIKKNASLFPSQATLTSRRREGQGWTRPELALLLAHTTLFLKHSYLHSPVLEDPLFLPLLEAYFPSTLVRLDKEALHKHPLHREILSLQLATFTLTQGGISFIGKMMQTTGRPASEIGYVFFLLAHATHLEKLREAVEPMQASLEPRTFYTLYRRLSDFYEKAIPLLFSLFPSGTAHPVFLLPNLRGQLTGLLSHSQIQHIQHRALQWENLGVPSSVAIQIEELQSLLLLLPLLKGEEGALIN